MKKRIFEELSDSEDYLHKAAWRVVKRQIEYAEANPTGATYDDLVAMVFAFLSIEGYLNFVLEKIAPEIWRNEKDAFARTGLYGKLSEVYKICCIPNIDKGRRPGSTISELKKLRNLMAHPKTHRRQERVKFPEGRPPPLFETPYLSTIVSHKKAIKARDDVQAIAHQIHCAACIRFPHAGLGHDALEGILGARSSSVQQA